MYKHKYKYRTEECSAVIGPTGPLGVAISLVRAGVRSLDLDKDGTETNVGQANLRI